MHVCTAMYTEVYRGKHSETPCAPRLIVQHAQQRHAPVDPVGRVMTQAGQVHIHHMICTEAGRGQHPLTERGLVQGRCIYLLRSLHLRFVDTIQVDGRHGLVQNGLSKRWEEVRAA